MHPHSLETYHEERGNLSARAAVILELFQRYGPMTDRQVMARLHFSDPNTARPRITELLQGGLLRETGHTIDGTTKKKVRVCSAMIRHKEKAQLSLL